MRTCPSCGASNADQAMACQWCGTPLRPSPLPPPPSATADPEAPLQYTHSGARYLLGYARDVFGIWDRERPGAPVERFPRTDEGWRTAWLRFVSLEPNHAEVGLGAGSSPATPGPAQPWGTRSVGWSSPPPRRAVSGWWWLLPILMGWLGGVIAWLVNRDADPQKAKQMLLTGIAVSVVGFILIYMAAATPPS